MLANFLAVLQPATLVFAELSVCPCEARLQVLITLSSLPICENTLIS